MERGKCELDYEIWLRLSFFFSCSLLIRFIWLCVISLFELDANI